MTPLGAIRLSIPEAAFVADMSTRAIDHEIDERVMPSYGEGRARLVSGIDLVYLRAIRDVRRELAPTLRKQLRDSIVEALEGSRQLAKVGNLQVALGEVAKNVRGNVAWLKKVKSEFIESHPTIMGGEPVLRGTRVPARLVAELVKKGIPHQEIGYELDLSSAQIEAAVTYDRATPRRGRPRVNRRGAADRVSPDR